MAAPDKTIDPRILQCAREEFLSKPYEAVSLREICAKAGVTTGALYNRYPNKAALFDALVEPTIALIYSYADSVEAFNYDQLDKNDMEKVWKIAPETQSRVVNLLYDHYQDFRLLLCRAEGTHHANFIHDFTDHVTDRTMTFVREAYQKGISSTLLDEEEMHMLNTAYWSTMFEPILHGLPREKALKHSELVARLFNWPAVLGF